MAAEINGKLTGEHPWRTVVGALFKKMTEFEPG